MEGTGYALGHSEREMRRLSAQARIFEPFTRRMITEAGVLEGMRVLDVGAGTGDVAFLCASAVGPAGQVIGVDRAQAAVETAQGRALSFGLGNVTFALGDPSEMSFEKPFDAIVGRLVLMHQPDPVVMLSKLSRLLRRGGIIAFQEFQIGGPHSFPSVPAYEQCMEWIKAAFAATGTDTQMGAKLYSAFIDAGLPPPSMSLDAGIWGGDDNPAAMMMTEVIRSLLPLLEKSGIATKEQVGINSLQDRIQREILAAGGVAMSPSLIGAWTRLTER